jgi:hypothetical protein
MIKKLLFQALTIFALSLHGQTFTAMYHFSSVNGSTVAGNTGTVDPTPPPTVSGVDFGSFMAFGTPSNTAANGVFAFSAWSLGATDGNDVSFTGDINPSQYYQVTISPEYPPATLDITSITYNMSRSATGPRNWAVRYNLDMYSSNLPASISPSNSNIAVQTGNRFFWSLDSYTVSGGKQERGSTISMADNQFHTNPLSFRIYAWNAEGSAGTFRIDTVVFKGSVTYPLRNNQLKKDIHTKFNLFPNPNNHGILNISAGESFSKVEILNFSGELINFIQVKSDIAQINTEQLRPGVYFVRISNGEKTSTEKFIVTQ